MDSAAVKHLFEQLDGLLAELKLKIAVEERVLTLRRIGALLAQLDKALNVQL